LESSSDVQIMALPGRPAVFPRSSVPQGAGE
jgi:hypothetical protein